MQIFPPSSISSSSREPPAIWNRLGRSFACLSRLASFSERALWTVFYKFQLIWFYSSFRKTTLRYILVFTIIRCQLNNFWGNRLFTSYFLFTWKRSGEFEFKNCPMFLKFYPNFPRLESGEQTKAQVVWRLLLINTISSVKRPFTESTMAINNKTPNSFSFSIRSFQNNCCIMVRCAQTELSKAS